uniref:Uncharacterized protein n=1 Tax=Oryza punctata TaxID=4537 RepID=A0A0E0LZT4_ORYPU
MRMLAAAGAHLLLGLRCEDARSRRYMGLSSTSNGEDMQMNSAWLVMVEKQTKLAVARRTKYLHKDTTLVTE